MSPEDRAEKRRAQAKARRAADPEKYRAIDKARRLANPEKFRERREASKEKTCAKKRADYAANPEKYRASAKAHRDANKERYRARQFKHNYDLTQADFDQMTEDQNGVCAICGVDNPRSRGLKRLFVDHCHKTGRVRGLLCHACNVRLAPLDRPDWLRKALPYLERAEQRRLAQQAFETFAEKNEPLLLALAAPPAEVLP